MASTRSRDVIIGIDAGTSLIKAVAFTRGGRQLGEFSLPNTYSTSPTGGWPSWASRHGMDRVIRSLSWSCRTCRSCPTSSSDEFLPIKWA